MEFFYHGSSALFDRFDLSHAFEGDGKCKFGYGVYVTQIYRTAAHYSGCGRGAAADEHFVYSVEVPEMTAGNHLWSNKPVAAAIVARAETRLGEKIPAEIIGAGKLFRKFLGNKALGRRGTVKQLSGKADIEAEKAAAEFLLSIGVEMLVWPYNQKNPDGEQNRAVLDERKVKIVKTERVELDEKVQLIAGTEKEVKL